MQRKTRKTPRRRMPTDEELSKIVSSLVCNPNDSSDFDDGDFQPSASEQLVKEGIFFLTGEVDDSIQSLIAAFLQKQIDPKWQSPLRLYINSPGGYAHSGWSLIDLMNLLRVPVMTIGMGMVCSMGAILLAAGTPGHRYVMPNTEIMIHQPIFYPPADNYSNVIANTEGCQQEYDRGVRFWMKVSKYKTQKAVEKYLMKKTDHFFTAKEALSHGIADQILTKDSFNV